MPTKYDEILAVMESAQQKCRTYQFECGKVLGDFRTAMTAFLGCEPGVFGARPLDEKDDEAKAFYAETGVMKLEEDGYWKVRFRLLLGKRTAVCIFVFLQKRDQSFILRIEASDTVEFRVPLEYDKETDFLEPCQWLFDAVKNFYDWTPERMISGEKRKVGFA